MFLIKKASRKLYLIQLNKKKTIILKFNRDNNWFINYYNYILFLNALKSIFLTNFNIAKIRRFHLLLRDKGEKNKKMAEKKNKGNSISIRKW